MDIIEVEWRLLDAIKSKILDEKLSNQEKWKYVDLFVNLRKQYQNPPPKEWLENLNSGIQKENTTCEECQE